jgi:hypothetical protein
LTYLSTAATMGDTVTAAVAAVAASMKILLNIFPCPFSDSAAILSIELGGETWTLIALVSRWDVYRIRSIKMA